MGPQEVRSGEGPEPWIDISGAILEFSEATEVRSLIELVARRVSDILRGTCVVRLLGHGEPIPASREITVPLTARGNAIGELALTRSRPFDRRELELARILGDHAAIAIANVEVLAATRLAAADRLRILTEASTEFSGATEDYHRLLDIVARRLGAAVGDMCAIRALAADGASLEPTGGVYHHDPALLEVVRTVMISTRQRVGSGVSGRVVANGEPLLIPHVDLAELVATSDPAFSAMFERLAVTSLITLPLICRGQVVGVANLMRSNAAHPYTEDDLRFVQSVAGQAAFAIANARSFAAEREARAEAAHATSAVATAESRFAQLFESAIIGIVASRLDGRVIDVNHALLRIVGYTREELLSGRVAWRDLTPEEWRGVDTTAVEQLLRTGIGELREKEYIHKSGRRVPVLVGSTMLPGADRECVSFVLDLTERKDSQLAIAHLRREHAADQTFRDLLESAPDAMVIADTGGVIMLVNGQVEALFGYSREDVIGQRVEMLVPERLRQTYPTAAAGRIDKGVELVGRRKDGSELPIEVTLSPLTTAGGLVVSSAIRDITDRKQAEQQRARLAAIVDASADAIIGKTLAGVVTSWNRGAQQLFGYTAEEMVGRSISVIVPPGRADEEDAILNALARGRTKSYDTVRRRNDGSEVDVSVTSSPVLDAEGRVIGISKVARDITDRKRAETALARARDVAEAANHELEAFSYSVAHDLRAPLRAMNGFAQLLFESYSDKFDEEGQDWLNEILGNSRKMAELIDALLSLSRVARNELVSESVDLSALVRAIASQLAAAEPSRVVELVIEDDLHAELDPRLARVVIDNLVRNAWKFTSKVAAARIEFAACETRHGRAFFVRDNGAGFDMAFATKLFAPFQRLHARTEFAGTGIGLATVQRIVHRHGGRVWAEGAVNHGATVFFSVPPAPELT